MLRNSREKTKAEGHAPGLKRSSILKDALNDQRSLKD